MGGTKGTNDCQVSSSSKSSARDTTAYNYYLLRNRVQHAFLWLLLELWLIIFQQESIRVGGVTEPEDKVDEVTITVIRLLINLFLIHLHVYF